MSQANNTNNEKVRTMATVANANIEVGTIIYTSWGYDQTNVEFFQVVKATKSMVELRRIGTKHNAIGSMSGQATPDTSVVVEGPLLRRKVNKYGYVKIDYCANGYVWDGKPKYVSSYA